MGVRLAPRRGGPLHTAAVALERCGVDLRGDVLEGPGGCSLREPLEVGAPVRRVFLLCCFAERSWAAIAPLRRDFRGSRFLIWFLCGARAGRLRPTGGRR